ncbi:MAG: peptide chain release factor N(5)-glutamine methyltransferase, partial [Oxalobacter sp.]|nr:peptide chain release factor N(5)-glutamine methyltransferase [Oxalobacter sp.]
MTPVTPESAKDADAALFAHIRGGIRIGALFRKPVVDPVDLRILLEYALGISHVQLLIQSERELGEKEAHIVLELLMRRYRGEPVAHIVGEREFYGLPFSITPDVLIPRPETELLVELAISRLPENGVLLDLGTGSGAIAVAVAHERPDVSVTATDVSPAALDVAKKNARRNLAAGRDIRFYQGEWFAALPAPFRFDLIVSNPPYIVVGDVHLSAGDLRYEPQGALTDFGDGLSAFRELTAHAVGWLNPNGWLLMEHGYDQAEAVRKRLLANGFASVQSFKD